MRRPRQRGVKSRWQRGVQATHEGGSAAANGNRVDGPSAARQDYLRQCDNSRHGAIDAIAGWREDATKLDASVVTH